MVSEGAKVFPGTLSPGATSSDILSGDAAAVMSGEVDPDAERSSEGKSGLPELQPYALSIDVILQSDRWSELADVEELAARAINAALMRADIALVVGAEICVSLADDAAVRVLNAEWRGLDKPTNVLSFPAVEPDELEYAPHIGDIILAYETVEREARDDGKTFADHTTHLIIHEILHLLGFDHETDEEAQEMEALEIAALADLGIADPYADFELET